MKSGSKVLHPICVRGSTLEREHIILDGRIFFNFPQSLEENSLKSQQPLLPPCLLLVLRYITFTTDKGIVKQSSNLLYFSSKIRRVPVSRKILKTHEPIRRISVILLHLCRKYATSAGSVVREKVKLSRCLMNHRSINAISLSLVK
jgi:hypothetical protein